LRYLFLLKVRNSKSPRNNHPAAKIHSRRSAERRMLHFIISLRGPVLCPGRFRKSCRAA
jgi:hypothetical protein